MGTHGQQRLPAIPGSPPDLTMPHSGCHFAARCPLATDICRSTIPDLVEVQDNHFVACHLQSKGQIVARKVGFFMQQPNELILKVNNLKSIFLLKAQFLLKSPPNL